MPLRRLPLLATLFALVTLLLACRGNPTTVLTRLEESRRLVTNLRVHFSQVVDASNRAVMADTEEASLAAALESKNATGAVEKEAAALAQLFDGLSYAEEARILREFNARFAEYRKLDSRIVALAVENTNLIAQALSLGPATQAADTFADSLRSALSRFPPKNRGPVELLVSEAVLSVREIQVLQAPHIAERGEAPMTLMEKKMAESDAKARGALTSLGELAPPEARSALAEALSALDRFKAVSAQIIELSRRNTNVLSLDLSLRQKPPLVVACSERLIALQNALAQEGPKSTR